MQSGSIMTAEPIIITTDDGTRFRCTVAAIGRENEPRWVLIDSSTMQFVGPPRQSDQSPEDVKRLINEWWEAKKASGGAK
jgi:hypothetical protein